MSLKNVLFALAKTLALVLLYFVLFNLSSGLVSTGLNWSPRRLQALMHSFTRLTNLGT